MRLFKRIITRFAVLSLGVTAVALALPIEEASAYPVRPMGANGLIFSYADSRCLDADVSSPTHNGTNVQVWDCNSMPNQRWTYYSDKTIRSSHDGRCLDVDTSSLPTGNGTRVQLWDCNGQSNQQWYIWTDQPSPILSAREFLCLDEDVSSPTHNGTRVQVWECNTWENQRWYH